MRLASYPQGTHHLAKEWLIKVYSFINIHWNPTIYQQSAGRNLGVCWLHYDFSEMDGLNKHGLHCSQDNFDPVSLNPEHIVLIIIYVTYCQAIMLHSKQPEKKSKGVRQKCLFAYTLGWSAKQLCSSWLGMLTCQGRLLTDLGWPRLGRPGRLCTMCLIFQ